MGEQHVTGSERRRFQRFSFEALARLYSQNAAWDTQLIDISMKGVLVERPQDFEGEVGGQFRLDLRLRGSVVISMGVVAAHVGAERIGLKWRSIDLDSFSRLKRLIELNLGDPNLLDRELSALGRD